ncbi:uncharacterized protein LOC110013266 [Sesamum indicum]|uniref:Uncharacterized protein LOC110013266 n=1 Tax=Sesamum indicum TaxID=4182 RepID=A0A8M8V7Q3_SESIN|nr:uncharacterized protein LOC110013266 [Sesamum indicum]
MADERFNILDHLLPIEEEASRVKMALCLEIGRQCGIPSLFWVLTVHRLFVKLGKCNFGVISMDYLGYVSFVAGFTADPFKLRGMVEWPTPTSLSALRVYLGLIGYYWHFVHHYTTIVAPLTDLLCKYSFDWTLVAESTFNAFKLAMVTLPIL